MTWWMCVLGGVVIVLVIYDAFSTTISATSASGPITHRLGQGVWRLLGWLARGPKSRLLSAAGPLVVLLYMLTWLLGLWAGWALVFLSEPHAVVSSQSGQPASVGATVYYAGFTTYTLGIGDFVPAAGVWQQLSVLATISGFAMVTLVIGYTIPLAIAVTKRRTLGVVLAGLGHTAQEIVIRGASRDDVGPLAEDLRRLAPDVAEAAQQHLSYPVLHYFHTPDREMALPPGIVALDEAMLLLEHGLVAEARPHAITTQPLRHALDRLAVIADDHFTGQTPQTPLPPALDPLREAGLPTVSDASYLEAVAGRTTHRRRMLAYLQGDHWTHERVASLQPR